MRAVLLLIDGKVQGVGMRYFIKRNALKLNVSGYAKNLSNGKVEALLIGEKENLDKLIYIIKNDSPGLVKSISVNETNFSTQWEGKFEIL
ncbi:MAG: acylphosphatase [Candidatus Calescibacterium sp.]|nr:acylphosphatase [Candidatus Calescibacterium sp.]MDW8132065.1 acylphosphatase [Candidatus Calescibacterium sp.]